MNFRQRQTKCNYRNYKCWQLSIWR